MSAAHVALRFVSRIPSYDVHITALTLNPKSEAVRSAGKSGRSETDSCPSDPDI